MIASTCNHPTRCPLVARGLTLRAVCYSCTGRPPAGQVTLNRGDILARAGEPAQHIFAVVEGWVRESIMDDEGRRTTTRFVGPGQVLGSEAMTSGEQRTTLDALQASRVCRVPVGQVMDSIAERPALGMAFTRALTDDMEALRVRIVRSTRSARERVLAMVVELLGPIPPGTWGQLPATREDMAEALGLTLETVSRQVQELHRAGVIEVDGRRMRLLTGI